MLISTWLILLPLVISTKWPNFLFVILGQDSSYDTEWTHALVESIIYQSIKWFEEKYPGENYFEENQMPLFYHLNGSEFPCHWQPLALAEKLINDERYQNRDFFIFLDIHSNIRIDKLQKFLDEQNPFADGFFGHGIHDKQMTIVHHYYGFRHDNEPPFYYPDISTGIVVTRSLLRKIANGVQYEHMHIPQFTIDAYHELAKFIFEYLKIRLESYPHVFCLKDDSITCGIYYTEPRYECFRHRKMKKIEAIDVKAYVKTWTGNYNKRLPYIQKTWGPQFQYIEYVGDVESVDPPVISLNIKNTERGHCAKTFAILRKYIENDDKSFSYLLIADDDTLINVDALMGPLNCYNPADMFILGERYGFGASLEGKGGYAYPTGGAGMVFTRNAAEQLIKTCSCPLPDSPDDMVIGMCSSAQNIPILHSPAFHQARPSDYPVEYINKIWPISFHKFNDINPETIYKKHFSGKKRPRPSFYDEPQNKYFDWNNVKSRIPVDVNAESTTDNIALRFNLTTNQSHKSNHSEL